MRKLDYATPEPRRRFWQKALFPQLVDSLDEILENARPQSLLMTLLVSIMMVTAILLLLARTLDLP